jgi:adenylylsulfate kinase-like enzyme
VKGLYAKAEKDEIESFTGKTSTFDEPSDPWLTLDTERQTAYQSTAQLESKVLQVINHT